MLMEVVRLSCPTRINSNNVVFKSVARQCDHLSLGPFSPQASLGEACPSAFPEFLSEGISTVHPHPLASRLRHLVRGGTMCPGPASRGRVVSRTGGPSRATIYLAGLGPHICASRQSPVFPILPQRHPIHRCIFGGRKKPGNAMPQAGEDNRS